MNKNSFFAACGASKKYTQFNKESKRSLLQKEKKERDAECLGTLVWSCGDERQMSCSEGGGDPAFA